MLFIDFFTHFVESSASAVASSSKEIPPVTEKEIVISNEKEIAASLALGKEFMLIMAHSLFPISACQIY